VTLRGGDVGFQPLVPCGDHHCAAGRRRGGACPGWMSLLTPALRAALSKPISEPLGRADQPCV